jgi:hypothetical protein
MKSFLPNKIPLLLMVFFTVGLYHTSNSQMIYGFKAGYAMNKLTGGDLNGGVNYHKQVSGGVILGYKFRTDFCFQSEILFNQAGMNQQFIEVNKNQQFDQASGKTLSTDTTFKHINELTLNYVTVPLLLKKSFSFKAGIIPYQRNTSILDFDIFAGPYVSYLISANGDFNTKIMVQKTSDNVVTETPVKERAIDRSVPAEKAHDGFFIGQNNTIVKADSSLPPAGYLAMYLPARAALNKGLSKLDVGVTVGLGFSIETSSHSKLTFDVRYSMGLLTIDKEYFSDIEYKYKSGGSESIGGWPGGAKLTKTITKANIKNSGFGAFLGYLIYLK